MTVTEVETELQTERVLVLEAEINEPENITQDAGNEILQLTGDSQCPPRYNVSEYGYCECNEGWEGYSCSKCRSRDACLSWLRIDPEVDEHAIGVRCGSDIIYSPATQMKSYKCELDGEQGNLLAPGSLAFTCLTTTDPYQLATLRPQLRFGIDDSLFVPLNSSGVGDGGVCTVTFALSQFPNSPLTCFATGCQFQSGSGNIRCSTTSCECPDSGCAAPEITVITQTIQRGVTMECDQTTKLCDISMDDLAGLKLRGQCEVGECVVPNAALVVGDGNIVEEDNRWRYVVITGFPLALVLAVYTVLLVSVHMDRRFQNIGQSRNLGSAVAEGREQEVSAQPQIEPNFFIQDSSSQEPMLAKQQMYWSDRELQFFNVCCVLPKKSPPILDNVTGYACSGEILAIIGPSGSGKTTLLNIISGSTLDIAAQSIISGDVKMGQKSTQQVFKGSAYNKLVAFVHQEDYQLPALTVQETLRYAAILKLGVDTNSEVVNQTIWKVVEDLGLERVFASKVGGRGLRGISGGERRRVSIAMELLTNPPILFLDEPTSGLDSFSAGNLIKLLKKMAITNDRIIAASLHQPSAEILTRLDRILLLAIGKVAYFGKAEEAYGWLSSIGLPCVQQVLIAEHMLSIVQYQQHLDIMFAKTEQDTAGDTQRYLSSKVEQGFQEVTNMAGTQGSGKKKIVARFFHQCKSITAPSSRTDTATGGLQDIRYKLIRDLSLTFRTRSVHIGQVVQRKAVVVGLWFDNDGGTGVFAA
eukprot:TRINITY_DN37458_c0_g2_i3.p1 TRINITY_DN37458_c0_g2~~TRINITY_DN37458_c0_g2_i3.p1  ORF type:complete len:859 (-),score=92.82 TRINITY_DN37458_c0_g2_i3:115-2379(-)